MATPAINGSSIPAAEACPAEIGEILHAAACGEELTFERGLVLASAEGSAQQALVAFADQLRRSEEHTSELQSRLHLVCRLLLEKKKTYKLISTRFQRASLMLSTIAIFCCSTSCLCLARTSQA